VIVLTKKTKDKEDAESKELLVAYRLCGSVCAYFAADRVIRSVTLDGHRDEGRGHLSLTTQQPDRPVTRETTELQIVSAFAGSIAESCFSQQRKSEFDPTSVDPALVELAHSVTGSSDEEWAYLHWLWEKSLNVFNTPGVFHFCGEMSAELVQKRSVDGKRAKTLWDASLQAAKY